MERDTLPFLTAPRDALREGLVTLKDGAAAGHPVEVIQRAGAAAHEASKHAMLEKVYGAGLPARLQIERQILGRPGRLPGLPSSRLGLDSMSGALDEFGFESYLNLPQDAAAAPPDMHSQMEAKLGLALPTVTRGGI